MKRPLLLSKFWKIRVFLRKLSSTNFDGYRPSFHPGTISATFIVNLFSPLFPFARGGDLAGEYIRWMYSLTALREVFVQDNLVCGCKKYLSIYAQMKILMI